MTSKEELEKMTVAQIKEKLKNRKLPTSGTKSDLVMRLFDSLVTEEKLLGESGPGTDNTDLSNVNVDELLGLDDETSAVSSAASESKVNDSLLSLGSPDSFEKSRNTTADKKLEYSPIKKPVIMTGTAQAQPQKIAETGQSKPFIASSDETGGEAAAPAAADGSEKHEEKAQPAPIDEEKKVQLKMAARLGVPLAESEAKAKRMARFGNGTAGNATMAAPNEEELKAKRAARFGGATTTITEEVSSVRKSASEEDGKMLIRAERFGLPLKRGTAESSGGVAASDEMLQKRAKRFGITAADAGNEDSKKSARAKRFGMT